MPERIPDPDWDPVEQGFLEPFLLKMIQLTSRARVQNVTEVEIVKRAIQEKATIIDNKNFEFARICSLGQVKPYYRKYSGLFEVSLGLEPTTGETMSITITREDIKTGLSIYAVFVYCSESVPLSQFLRSLLSTQSPRTIIKATVNTIASDDIKENFNRKGLNLFYGALDKIFNFQLGKILLAISSPEEIKLLMNKERPYFAKYINEIDKCFNNTNCMDVVSLINDLGS